MRDIDKISEKVRKRKEQLQPLWDKDEENYDLWSGKEQTFDTHKMAINITGTEMVALSLRVQASLVRSRLDVHVLPPTPLPNPDAVTTANQEERMYYHGFEKADEKLSLTGDANLLSSASWQAVVLGRIAVRVLVYLDENNEVCWDYLPLNPRFLTFSFDSKGLAWACYETFRSPDSIKEEYGKEVIEDAQGKGVSVSDYWDRQDNVTYLTKERETLETRKSKGEVPIILQPITRSPRAIDVSGIRVETWGESIFDHVKIPFKNLNKMKSIAATHAHVLSKNPVEIIYEDGTEPNIEEEHFQFHAGSKIKHPRSVEFKSMSVNDIPNSLVTMMGDISAGIERATYAELSPDKPGHSGSALRILGQDKQDVLTPRVGALNSMYTRICRMAKKQIIAQELTIPVRTVVNKTYEIYDMAPDMLDNDFFVRAELIKQDVYDEEASLSRAQMLMQNRLMSRESVMERILNEQDVPAEITKMDYEDAKVAIPELGLIDLIQALEEDMKVPYKAGLVRKYLGMMVAQKQQETMDMTGFGGEPPPEGAP